MVAATALVGSGPGVFERFFAQEYPRAVAIALRITGDAAEAEDVAQEVFVRCARARRYDRPGAGAWVHAAAAHSALNAVRSRKRRIEREARSYHLQHVIETGAQHGADPQTIVERRYERSLVRAALLRISQADAQLLALRHAGLSYRECADALAIDVKQIGTRLARAERAFKKEIERGTS